MATNKSNESIDDKAFQALEDALKIDFDELKSALNDKTSLDDPEGKVSEAVSQAPAPSQAKTTKSKDEAARSARTTETPRSLAPEPAPKAPSFAPANDDGRRTPAAILRWVNWVGDERSEPPVLSRQQVDPDADKSGGR